jgi:hypothetical protein
MKTNEEKAREIANNCSTEIIGAEVSDETYITTEPDCYDAALTMAKWKDEQPIMESDGWHTEEPTENGWYLVDTPDFPKNCECVVAEWDNDAKHFYDEHSDFPIKFNRWKLIERG